MIAINAVLPRTPALQSRGPSKCCECQTAGGTKRQNERMWGLWILSAASFGTIGALIGEKRGAKGGGAAYGILLGPIGLLLLVLTTDPVPSHLRTGRAAATGGSPTSGPLPAAAPQAERTLRAPRFTSGADLRAIRKAARAQRESHQHPEEDIKPS